MRSWDEATAIWVVDFEFTAPPGDVPVPICVVAHEIRDGRTIRLWLDDSAPQPPFGTSPHDVVVPYFATAEVGCYLALGWDPPPNLIDLYVEFR